MKLPSYVLLTVSVTLLLGASPVFFALWIILRLTTLGVRRTVYEAGDDYLYSLYQKFVVFFMETCTGIELILTGDVAALTAKKENVLFLSNHQCTVDWAIADMLAIRQGSIGHIRYILKDSLKYLPLYGFYFRQHGCIYVRRSGHFQSDQAMKQLNLLALTTTPFWMVVFPEGTRYNPDLPEVIVKSQSFSEAKGLPGLKHVLLPRSKAVYMCVNQLHKRLDAIYDVTIAYSNTRKESDGHVTRIPAPTLSKYLSGVCNQVHIDIQRIPINSVPVDHIELDAWLVKRFQEKDRRMQSFYSAAGVLDSTVKSSDSCSFKLPLSQTLPVFILWIVLIVPMWFTSQGLAMYTWLVLFGLMIGGGWALFFS